MDFLFQQKFLKALQYFSALVFSIFFQTTVAHAAPYLTALHACLTDPGTSANCAADTTSFTVNECTATDGVCSGAAGDTVFHVTGSYTDSTGCANVTGQGANALKSLQIATSTANCSTSNGLNCISYANIGNGSGTGSCVFSVCGDGVTDGTFNCTVPLRYNSEPDTTTHWKAFVTLNNGTEDSTLTSYTSSTFDIAANLAIGTSATLTFKQMDGTSNLIAYSSVGGYMISTSGDTMLTVYNTGNTSDTHFRFFGMATGTVTTPAQAFVCTSGGIPNTSLKWQLTSGVMFGSMASNTPYDTASWFAGSTSTLGISTSNDISAGAKQIVYFKLFVPAGVSGDCAGSLYFSGI